MITRTPSLTIHTNSYHFCKLSLVKKPSYCLRQGERIKQGYDWEIREIANAEASDDSSRMSRGSPVESSSTVEGLCEKAFQTVNVLNIAYLPSMTVLYVDA